MDQNKIGKHLQELRKANGMSQEDVASKVNVVRQSVSKWEKGKSLPDSLMIKDLSKIYNVSVSEILNGEPLPEDSEDDSSIPISINLTVYEDRNKKTRMLRKAIIIIIVLVVLFLAYYFINSYNSITIYKIKANTNYNNLYEGTFVVTKEKVYFNLNAYKANPEIETIKLYYKDKNGKEMLAYETTENLSSSINLIDNYKYNAYFDYSDLKHTLNNIYLYIKYKDKEETVKLDITKDYSNASIFFKSKDYSNDRNSISNDSAIKPDKLVNLIESKFKKIDDYYNLETTYKGKKATIIYMDGLLSIKILGQEKTETWTYNIDFTSLIYELTENGKSVEYFEFNVNDDNCVNGNCKNNKDFWKILHSVLD